MMATPPPPEFAIICIDNGRRALQNSKIYHAQLKGARYYCETLLKFNPGSLVSIFTMSTESDVILAPATRDLQKLLDALEHVPHHFIGETDFYGALADACTAFSRGAAPKMKRRLLMFVGRTINLSLRDANSFGKELKEKCVALDVFNFCYLKNDPLIPLNKKASIFQGEYHYARSELQELVANVNYEGNSFMEDIVDEYESSVLGTLKKRFHYLEKKAAADVEKSKSDADGNNKSVEAMELEPSNLQFGK